MTKEIKYLEDKIRMLNWRIDSYMGSVPGFKKENLDDYEELLIVKKILSLIKEEPGQCHHPYKHLEFIGAVATRCKMCNSMLN